MFIALAVLFSIIVAVLLGISVWRLALRGKASKEAQDAKQPVPELTFQDFVNGLVLLIGLGFAALGIKWAFKQDAAKKAIANGRR